MPYRSTTKPSSSSKVQGSPFFLALHTLRLKGFAQPDSVSRAICTSESDAAALLDSAVSRGLAIKRDGRISGYTLTAVGRQHHADLLAEDIDPGDWGSVRPAY